MSVTGAPAPSTYGAPEHDVARHENCLAGSNGEAPLDLNGLDWKSLRRALGLPEDHRSPEERARLEKIKARRLWREQNGIVPAVRPVGDGSISMGALKNVVVKPGIEKHLEPLQLYRGNLSMGRIKRMWNHVQVMHLLHVDNASDGARLHNHPDYVHLLGPSAVKLPIRSVEAFLRRLQDNPNVCRNVQGLESYVSKEVSFQGFELRRLSEADRYSRIEHRRQKGAILWESERKGRAHARTVKQIETERSGPASAQLFYPYMIHDPKTDESDLVKFVNGVVPKGLLPDIRADACQEMLLAILAGEISREQAHCRLSFA